MRKQHITVPIVLLFLLISCGQVSKRTGTAATADSVYRVAPASSPDGTGRLYMGREIAHTMSHYGAVWLDRAERLQEERTDLLLKLMETRVKPTDAIADIGAGSGYMSFRLSALVPAGTVYAVDIQPEMLAIIQAKKEKNRIANIQTILGTITDPKLPDNSADWVLLVDAYHEFSNPYEMMLNISRALKPTGKVILVEYRAEDKSVPIKPLHKMTEVQAKKEMASVGLTWIETQTILPWQHLMIFGKSGK